jgi:hypothetical protein
MSEPKSTTRGESRDDRLAQELACGAGIAAAAQAAGVSERTVVRRRADPSFRKRVTERRTAMLNEALGRLTHASAAAAAVIVRLMLEAEDPAIKLRAAKVLLQMGIKLGEYVDLEQRVAVLEQRVEFAEADRKQAG